MIEANEKAAESEAEEETKKALEIAKEREKEQENIIEGAWKSIGPQGCVASAIAISYTWETKDGEAAAWMAIFALIGAAVWMLLMALLIYCRGKSLKKFFKNILS